MLVFCRTLSLLCPFTQGDRKYESLLQAARQLIGDASIQQAVSRRAYVFDEIFSTKVQVGPFNNARMSRTGQFFEIAVTFSNAKAVLW